MIFRRIEQKNPKMEDNVFVWTSCLDQDFQLRSVVAIYYRSEDRNKVRELRSDVVVIKKLLASSFIKSESSFKIPDDLIRTCI
jgi:hypothetical protein